MSQFMDSKEFANEQMKDIFRGIKYDIDTIIEKLEGQSPENYNYSFLEDFLSSITSGSIQARRLADRLKQEVRHGKV